MIFFPVGAGKIELTHVSCDTANVKQVLTIILAVLIFNISLNPMKVFGISLTLCGGAYYAKVELQEKSRSTPAPTLGVRTPSTPLEEKRMLA